MSTRTAKELDYPDSDGKPLAETDVHIDLVLSLRERLKAFFAADSNVYVAGNLFVYYTPGQPKECLAPDGFVVFGVPNRRRRSFKVWEEGKLPDVVFEITSERTQDEDLHSKWETYQKVWKVKEYFLFDPLEEYLQPSLIGYRMVKGEFRAIKPTKGVLTSKALGITLARDGTQLILRDAATGVELLTRDGQKAAAERVAREAAEAEIARLRAELAALRSPPTSDA